MADEVWASCDKAQSFGQTVAVKIKYADFRQVTRSRTLQNPITSQATLKEVSLVLVRSVFPVTIGIRLVGVELSNFQNGRQAATVQLNLGLTGTAV
jgi:DNA polymerase-4